MKMYKGYDMSLNKVEGKASRKRALIQSIKKWMMLSTVPANKLVGYYHTSCALCVRYCERCDRKTICPLDVNGKGCAPAGELWDVANTAYDSWCNSPTTTNFRRYRKAARALLCVLQEAFDKLYGEKWKE